MGLYFRKSISVGPFRFTLSPGGVGASVGVGGVRAGTGVRGSYVSVSGAGVSYRQALGGGASGATPATSPPKASATGPIEITTGDVLHLSDVGPDDVLHQLNAAVRERNGWTVPLLLLAAGALVGAVYTGRNPAWLPASMVLGINTLVLVVAAVRTHRAYLLRSTTVLFFDVDDDTALRHYDALCEGLRELTSCQGIWHVATEARVYDRKRNAGAGMVVQRTPARKPWASTFPGASCNVDVPTLHAGRETLYFLPDRLLVFDTARRVYGALPYPDLEADLATTNFVEAVAPRDAQVVDTTWERVNRDGGPDRRFKSNRQMSVCRYGELTLRSEGGLLERFQFSKLGASAAFLEALQTLGGQVVGRSNPPVADAPMDVAAVVRGMAFATVLRSLAVADRRFTPEERSMIVDRLVTWSVGDVDQVNAVLDSVPTDAEQIAAMLAHCATLAHDDRQALALACEELVMADGKATPKEKARLADVRRVLLEEDT